MLQRAARQELERDEGLAALLTDVVHRADARMIQSRRGLGFPLKAVEGLRILDDLLGEKLQGNGAPEPQVLGFVNDPHASAAQFAKDAVMREGLPDHLRRSSWAPLASKLST